MTITLDGQNLFEERMSEIELGSAGRDSIDRTIAGADGVLSIDLGARGRKIKQKGQLRAKSRTQLQEQISAISSYLDGNTYTLVTANGDDFDNLRMDSFETGKERTSGSGIVVDYEVVYTQLKV